MDGDLIYDSLIHSLSWGVDSRMDSEFEIEFSWYPLKNAHDIQICSV